LERVGPAVLSGRVVKAPDMKVLTIMKETAMVDTAVSGEFHCPCSALRFPGSEVVLVEAAASMFYQLQRRQSPPSSPGGAARPFYLFISGVPPATRRSSSLGPKQLLEPTCSPGLQVGSLDERAHNSNLQALARGTRRAAFCSVAIIHENSVILPRYGSSSLPRDQRPAPKAP